MKKALLPVLFLCTNVLSVSSQPGALDPCFGAGGVVITHDVGTEGVNKLLIQSDGKILAAGLNAGSSTSTYSFGLFRYLADGSADSTFGTNGWAEMDTSWSRAYGAALQPDGKIVLTGITAFGSDWHAVTKRYTTSGHLDSTFGINGSVVTLNDFEGGMSAAVIQPDGKIVTAGYSKNTASNMYSTLFRYNTNGQLDPGFGNGGVANIPNTNSSLGDVKLQSDGKIVALSSTRLYRLTTAGVMDSTFGTNGVINLIASAKSVVIQPDGRLLTGGSLNGGFVVARYTSAGTVDSTYGTGGKTVVFIDSLNAGINALALQPDGKAVAVGQSHQVSQNSSLTVARFNISGTLDSAFANNGVDTLLFGWTNSLRTVATQADGKIVTAGVVYQPGGTWAWDYVLLRYNSVATAPPVAAFDTASLTVCPATCVSFSHQSVGADCVKWLFDGGPPAASTVDNPTVCYNTPGQYQARLVAYNQGGTDTLIQFAFVTVLAPPSAAFVTQNDSLMVIAGMTSYQWSFNGVGLTGTGPGIGLQGNGSYAVTLTDANGCTATSTFILGGCTAPTGSTANNITSSSGLTSWTSNATAMKYRVRVKNMATGQTSLYIVSAPDTIKALTGLSPNTLYKVRVRSQCSTNGSILSPWSPPVYFTTQGTTATVCIPPTNITATAMSNSTASINWTAINGSNGYQLRHRILGSTSWTPTVVNNGTTTNATLTGLTPNTTYQYQMRTKCSTNPLAWSNYSAVQTFATPLRLGESDETLSISLYPNPSTGHVTFNPNGLVGTLTVYNGIGQPVRQIERVETQTHLDDLPAGVLIYTFVTHDGKAFNGVVAVVEP